MVHLDVLDPYGCPASDQAYVLVHPNPVLDLGEDTQLCGEETLVLSVPGFSTYLWSTGETGNSITVGAGAGIITLMVTDENGCPAKDSLIIEDCNPEELFDVITNTFTPNNDGVHDTWVINNIDLYPEAVINVFDRTGRLVFHVEGGYENDWDGTFNGKPLPMDTYYYIIDFKSDDIEPRKGTVTIAK